KQQKRKCARCGARSVHVHSFPANAKPVLQRVWVNSLGLDDLASEREFETIRERIKRKEDIRWCEIHFDKDGLPIKDIVQLQADEEGAMLIGADTQMRNEISVMETQFSIVDEWRKKSFDTTDFSDDIIISVISQGFDVMFCILSEPYDYDSILQSLTCLDSQRAMKQTIDPNRNEKVRELMYGIFQSMHFTLTQLIEEKNEMKKIIADLTSSNVVQIKEEPGEFLDVFSNEAAPAENKSFVAPQESHVPGVIPKEEEGLETMDRLVEEANRDYLGSQSTLDITVKRETLEDGYE
ncbi:hypothetical protein PENTCL1PPCAC_7235, partial [Pristionchus entomophagus]